MARSEAVFTVTPPLRAALLLLAMEMAPKEMKWPWARAELLELTGASRSQSYELLARLRDLLPQVFHTPGRPASTTTQRDELHVVKAVRDYLLAHPGSACGRGERCRYTDAFRRFVVGLAAPEQPGSRMSLEDLADACAIPVGTLKDWMRLPAVVAANSPSEPSEEAEAPLPNWVRVPQLRTLVRLWGMWAGTFQAFCRMVRDEHRLEFGDTYIGNFLQGVGLRKRRLHPRSVEAPWSHDTFRLLFPGAQWLGDGTTLAIRFQWTHQVFVFNIQLFHDPAADAAVGFTISDNEDETAVVEAFQAGIETTGQSPHSSTLDNKPCNHTPTVEGALDEAGTVLLAATPKRGQAKAPLEGSFGLFQQALPQLAITGSTPRELARSALRLILTA